MDVSHGGVDDRAVRHPLWSFGLGSGHHLLLRGFLVEDVSIGVGALGVLRLPLCELSRNQSEYLQKTVRQQSLNGRNM